MNGKVLIVDDDPSVLTTLGKYLVDGGYEVRSAPNGADAQRIVPSAGPLIIIAASTMPEMDGLQLCRSIRLSEKTGIVYFIMLVASADETRLVEAFEAGADDYLMIPCNREQLLVRIRGGERVLNLLHQAREQKTALETAQRKVEQTSRELEQVHCQLLQADKMASIGQLAAGVAHEINNPIGFISSNLNSLEHYVNDLKRVLEAHEELMRLCLSSTPTTSVKAQEVEALREETGVHYIISDIGDLISESVEGTQRLRQIVADLRDFSHVDNPNIREENINQLMDRSINVAWNELKYKAQVVREYGEIPPIPCYGGKLGQVFLNLLVNAAQAIEQRGTITIRTGQGNGHLWVQVSDTGRGISPEDLERIFDPFFTTKEVGTGTGMGLHLAYKIIEDHGGRIDAESTEGAGTTFRIELPAAGPPQAEVRQNESVA